MYGERGERREERKTSFDTEIHYLHPYLDDDGVSREVHSPGQCGRADENFDKVVGEQSLHEVAV